MVKIWRRESKKYMVSDEVEREEVKREELGRTMRMTAFLVTETKKAVLLNRGKRRST